MKMDRFARGRAQDSFAEHALTPDENLADNTISTSWARCSSFGLNPAGKPVDAVTSNTELSEIIQENQHIRKFVLPELELLYNQIAGTNFMVAYADTRGVVLDALLDEEFKKSDAGKAVIPGSIWTENYRGTNALGLALHSGASQIVAGQDHFFRKLGNLSCFAAPIYGQDDQIVGVIDATSDAASRQQHTLALVKLASKNVENRLFIDQFSTSSIIAFHARHEYLSTTSAALLAVDDHGFIEGANINAKIMLNGLNLSQKQHFRDIFAIPFSAIINRLNSDEIIRIQDTMGSAVFMLMKESTTKRIVHMPVKPNLLQTLKTTAADTASDCKTDANDDRILPKYIDADPVLKRHLALAQKALEHQLPVFIEGARGTGKKTTAVELHQQLLGGKPFVEIDGKLLTECNHESVLFGPAGKLTYFDHQPPSQARGKLAQATGGTLFLSAIDALPKAVQDTLSQVLEAYHEPNSSKDQQAIGGFVFSSRYAMSDLQQQPNMEPVFLENLLGAQISLPSLSQRTDFRKLTVELLRQIAPNQRISKAALDALETRDWPGNIGQLKKVLRILVASAEGPIIRNANLQIDHTLSGSDVTPCETCTQSPMRKESCLLIKKTWLETGGNISLVSRRLGISRTTVYKHVTSMS
jgi:transcriptional regulator of acetoin/glycerol metabolism|tara:strand:- start:261 stop:2186 length:1926 start_codon:yes stop_codon:yes gene_type:complete